MRSKVFLAGAGPGAFDLITMRAVGALSRADVVIYDYLVNPELLRLAPNDAKLIYAGKKGGGDGNIDQGALNRMLIAHARKGKTVVRLKGGDPFIFGRGGEEAEALARARVPFEVVPGVTSAIAAPAFAGIPLTHRDFGSFVTFVTGHEDERKRKGAIPWESLATAARSGGTLVLLMATARMRATLKRLVDGGLAGATPAAAVQWGTTAAQRTVSATLATLADACTRERIGAPAAIVVGRCAELRQALAWAEKMPLFGRRIVITRARDKASVFAAELARLGAEVIEFPTIETAPPSSFATLDRAIKAIDRFDWIIFTSATGVEAFVERLKTLKRDIRSIGRASIAAIGPATAERLRDYALNVAAMPAEFRAEAIIDAIGARKIAGARILIPRAQVAREVLPKLLRQSGAREVVVAPAYRTVQPKGQGVDRLRTLTASNDIDLVAFTSSSTVANFSAMLGKNARGLKAAAIGPITADTARRGGFDVVVEPADYTIPALVNAICRHFERARANANASA
ncbi:MAG TPA: uroporphyrinogen-III C-methyltransferase [Candidatus Binataceae bacterium]|nr:uroporphyrinogen-III C-methyltransferase [Candidatus Binataceae bacterium]